MTYPNYLNAFAKPYNALTQVSGIEGAKAYQMPPNSVAALFHNDEDVFFVKTTDGAVFPSIRAFRFEEIEAESARDAGLRREVDAMRKELENVEQSVQQLAEAIRGAADEGEPAGDIQSPDEQQPSV